MNYQQVPQVHIGKLFITAIILAVAIALGGYSILFLGHAGAQTTPLITSDLSATSTGLMATSPFSPEQLALLSKIESLDLDGSLFSDPIFLNLRDWTSILNNEDVGRVNPFAPVGGLSQATTTVR